MSSSDQILDSQNAPGSRINLDEGGLTQTVGIVFSRFAQGVHGGPFPDFRSTPPAVFG